MLMNIDTFIDMKTWNITGDVENQSLKKPGLEMYWLLQ